MHCFFCDHVSCTARKNCATCHNRWGHSAVNFHISLPFLTLWLTSCKVYKFYYFNCNSLQRGSDKILWTSGPDRRFDGILTMEQRCNDSAFWDSRLNSDSDKVFGFNSNSILQDAHCNKTRFTIQFNRQYLISIQFTIQFSSPTSISNQFTIQCL